MFRPGGILLISSFGLSLPGHVLPFFLLRFQISDFYPSLGDHCIVKFCILGIPAVLKIKTTWTMACRCIAPMFTLCASVSCVCIPR